MNFDNILPASIRKETFTIPKEMTVMGSFKTDASGQVAGIVNGDILVKGKVIILKDGIINGDISAEELIVFGKINGNVKKCIKMTARSGAIIKGNISTIEIHIEKDAVIEGLITKSGTNTIISKPAAQENKSRATETSSFNENDMPAERHAWF